MRWWALALALGVSCTGRPFVASDAGEETSGLADAGASSDGAQSDGIVSVSASASVDDDGGGGDDEPETTGGDTDTGLGCADPVAPPITVDVYPGANPLEAEGGVVSNEWDCEIQVRMVDGAGVTLGLNCEIEPQWIATVMLTVDADGITVPEDLDYPARVHLRVQTYRDAELVGEFPWLRSDHFAMYRDDELVLGVGAGGWWPTTDGGADFWAPFRLESASTRCMAAPRECHDSTQAALRIGLAGENLVAPSFSVVSIGGYDVHVGEMIASDSPSCDEPGYGWSSFAIAPTPG